MVDWLRDRKGVLIEARGARPACLACRLAPELQSVKSVP